MSNFQVLEEGISVSACYLRGSSIIIEFNSEDGRYDGKYELKAGKLNEERVNARYKSFSSAFYEKKLLVIALSCRSATVSQVDTVIKYYFARKVYSEKSFKVENYHKYIFQLSKNFKILDECKCKLAKSIRELTSKLAAVNSSFSTLKNSFVSFTENVLHYDFRNFILYTINLESIIKLTGEYQEGKETQIEIYHETQREILTEENARNMIEIKSKETSL